MSALRDTLYRSLAQAEREAVACLGHDVILPAARLMECGGKLQAAAMLGDSRFAPDAIREIDAAINELVQFRLMFKRRVPSLTDVEQS